MTIRIDSKDDSSNSRNKNLINNFASQVMREH